jgi:hypothetical protein
MKKGMTRRSFLRNSGLVTASLALAGLSINFRAGSSLNLHLERQESDERLEYITERWRTGRGHVEIEGWNSSGLWSFYCDEKTGRITGGFYWNYRDAPFMKYDGYEHKTLAQLRAEGVSWEEIDRLHNEGFSRRPDYIHSENPSA